MNINSINLTTIITIIVSHVISHVGLKERGRTE